jgi:hypothetical protein
MLFDPPPGRSGRAAAQRIVRAFRAAQPTPPFDCVPEFPALGRPHWRAVTRHRHAIPCAPAAPGVSPGNRQQLFERRCGTCTRNAWTGAGPCSGCMSSTDSTPARWRSTSSRTTRAGMVAPRWRVFFGTLASEPGPIRTPFFALPPQPPPHAPQGESTRASPTVPARCSLMRLRRVNCCRRWQPDAAAPATEPDVPAGNQPFGGPQTRFNQPVAAERSFAAFSLPNRRDAARRARLRGQGQRRAARGRGWRHRALPGRVRRATTAAARGDVPGLDARRGRPRGHHQGRDDVRADGPAALGRRATPAADRRQQRRGKAGVPRAVESRGTGLRADCVRRLVRLAQPSAWRP